MEILKHPHPALRKKCRGVRKIDRTVQEEARTVSKTLKKKNKWYKIINGLAANQIGIQRRIVVLKQIINKYTVMINPKIVESRVTVPSIEICFSLPGIIRIKKEGYMLRLNIGT